MEYDRLLSEYYRMLKRNDLSKRERKKIMNEIAYLINKKEFEEAKQNLAYDLNALFNKIFRRYK